MNIVGIAGLPRSGKDTLAEWFTGAGYFGVSLGDIVRREAKSRHASKKNPISVANMTETANYLRQQYGPDVILKKAVADYESAKKNQAYKGLLVYSVRTPVEADFIRKHKGRLIWVDTDDDIRFARAVEFSRDGEMEGVDMDSFLAQEELQWQPKPGIPKEAQMNVAYVKNQATDTIKNNENSIESFHTKAKPLID